ncbi:MAG: hypothetical protein DI629_10405 [Mesorhizobium amorphae]|nr:MAG: hypothetical protein DI629_10405 [Mesorhizobium amorphae]
MTTLLSLGLLGSAALPAASFELFGYRLWGEDPAAADADVIGEPQRYTLEVTVAGDDSTLESTVEGASTLYADRDEPASGSGGLLAKARGDYQRLLYAMYGQGRYGPTISISVGGREASDIPPDAELPDPVAVVVSVDPGPEFRFGQAEIVNRAPPPVDEDDEVDLPEDQGFVSGEVARSGAIVAAGRLSVEAWREQGHPKAELAQQRIEAAHDQNLVDAQLTVEPGPRAVYGPTSVSGTERMDPAFVAFMTDLPPGQEFDPDDIKRASNRLTRLDVFRSARIEEAESVNPDGTLPMSVIVQERPLRRFGAGASYSTLDGAGIEAYWLHRNLFGRAERLRFDARVAGIGGTNSGADGFSVDPADLTYRVGGTFTKPGVYTPDTDFVSSLFGDREVLDPYTRTGVNAQLGFTQLINEDLSVRLLGEGGYDHFIEKAFEDREREFVSVGLLGGLTYDKRDNKTNATEGYYLDLLARPYYEIEYGNPTLQMTAEGRAYFGFGEDDPFVLAARLKIGSVVGAPLDEVAPDRLFLAGGGGSVRGYAYRNIGLPVFDAQGRRTDDETGGRSLLEGSIEARVKVTESIGVVAFADAGLVGPESFPDFSQDPRVGVGAGLRYLTGLGPIRLDVAMPLDPQPGDPSVGFYVGLGQAF